MTPTCFHLMSYQLLQIRRERGRERRRPLLSHTCNRFSTVLDAVGCVKKEILCEFPARVAVFCTAGCVGAVFRPGTFGVHLGSFVFAPALAFCCRCANAHPHSWTLTWHTWLFRKTVFSLAPLSVFSFIYGKPSPLPWSPAAWREGSPNICMAAEIN